MTIGKLKNDLLNKVVLSEIKKVRQDVLIRPSVGEDCSAIAFGNEACVVTTDPITGSGSHLGALAVHVCVNDIASSGATPVGILLTLLCPEDTTPEEINGILKEASEVASQMSIEIIGGHTEITDAVNKIIVSATAIGRTESNRLIRTGGAKADDYIYMTKHAGLEGTAIIATDKRSDLVESFSNKELAEATEMFKSISVLKEGLIGKNLNVSAMHDATEGGVIGAIHEMCEASGVGCRVWNDEFLIKPITLKICDFYHIDPLKLIASGCMILAVPPASAGDLERAFLEANIPYSRVGVVTEKLDKLMVYGEEFAEEVFETIEMPNSDELYKVI